MLAPPSISKTALTWPWQAEASDVDKKKGRKLDPNEDLRNKGFKARATLLHGKCMEVLWQVMKDLMDYKFAEREKKSPDWACRLWMPCEVHPLVDPIDA